MIIPIGFRGFVNSERIMAVILAQSAPTKRVIEEAKQERKLIDATYGRFTRAVLITDTNIVILSAREPQVITKHWKEGAK